MRLFFFSFLVSVFSTLAPFTAERSADSIAFASLYLASASFDIAFMTTRSRATGISGFISQTGVGISVICIIATPSAVSLSKGTRPVSTV